MDNDGELQCFRFSTAALAERDRVEEFRETFGRAILRISIEPSRECPLDVDMTLRGLKGLGVASGHLSPMCNSHSAADADNDDVVLVVLQAGSGVVRQAGREAELSGGQAVLTTNGESGTFLGPTATKLINFRFSRRMLAEHLFNLDANLVTPIAPDTEALRLLTTYGAVLGEARQLETPELRRMVVTHMHDLAVLLIGGSAESRELARGRGLRAARRREVKAAILRMLLQPNLSIVQVARHQAVSPRYIQMLFEEEGTTFSEFVLMRRLEHSRTLLINPMFDTMRISDIALQSGFSDVSHFNHAFRRRFGMTPREMRENGV